MQTYPEWKTERLVLGGLAGLSLGVISLVAPKWWAARLEESRRARGLTQGLQ